MAELDARLNQILNDPAQLARVMDIARQLMGGAAPDAPASPPSEDGAEVSGAAEFSGAAQISNSAEAPAEAIKTLVDDVPALLAGLNISPGLTGALARALAGINGSNKRISLLTAVLPFVAEERKEMVRRAIHAMKLAGAARAALGDSLGGLLGGETRHV